MNRATADTAQEAALAEGLAPLMGWVKRLVDHVIQDRMGHSDLEFAWVDLRPADPAEQAKLLDLYVRDGIYTVNEARDILGFDPVAGGEAAMVYANNGAVPLAVPARRGSARQPETRAPSGDAELDSRPLRIPVNVPAIDGNPAMIILSRRLGAALISTALVVAASLPTASHLGLGGSAWAQSASVEVPAYRQLGASEAMAPPGQNGADYSANAGSLSGLTLLAAIPAPSAPRLGVIVQAQCTAGLSVALDDPAGSLTPTIIVLAGAVSNGGQGGELDLTGMPHTGRIRIYSSSASCQMAARAW